MTGDLIIDNFIKQWFYSTIQFMKTHLFCISWYSRCLVKLLPDQVLRKLFVYNRVAHVRGPPGVILTCPLYTPAGGLGPSNSTLLYTTNTLYSKTLCLCTLPEYTLHLKKNMGSAASRCLQELILYLIIIGHKFFFQKINYE